MIIPLLKKKIAEHHILTSFLLSIVFLIISAISTYLHFPASSENNIILYLDLYRDTSVLGNVSSLYQFVSLGFVLILVNFLISRELASKRAILASFISIISIVLSILILIAIGGIIHLN